MPGKPMIEHPYTDAQNEIARAAQFPAGRTAEAVASLAVAKAVLAVAAELRRMNERGVARRARV